MEKSLLFTVWIFLSVLLINCQSTPYTHQEEGLNILVDSIYTPDSLMTQTIQPYKDKIDSVMNKVIGISEQQMLSYYPESPLSNFVTDVVQLKAEEYLKNNTSEKIPLLTLINMKGLRAPLPKGEITTRDIFQLMPFENEIVILKLPGKSILELFEYLALTNGEGISGARIVYANSKIKTLKINESDFDVNKEYYLATSDYVASGGDNFTMVTHPITTTAIGCKVREAITLYIEELNNTNKTIVSNKDGRIIFE